MPFAVTMIIFGIIPIVLSIYVAFTESASAMGPAPRFVGFANFQSVLADPLFVKSLWSTVLYTVLSVAMNVALALGLALLLISSAVGRMATFYKLALFLPVVTPEVATFIVWKWMFNQDFGAVNAALTSLGLPAFGGTTTDVGAFTVLVVVELWHHVGFYTLVFLANLQLLDHSLDEAAQMDGAGPLKRIWLVWIPQLRPAIAINMIYATIEFLKTFTAVIVITSGGPNFATNFVSYYAYKKFDIAQYGEATAMATVLFIVVLVVTVVAYAYHERRDYR
jgi:ABC-type sugar transport system permease subunit